MRIALATPFDPTSSGNGASLRAHFWRELLAEMGELTTFVIPVSTPPPSGDPHPELGELRVVQPLTIENPDIPSLAQQASEYLGVITAEENEPFDLIVGFRSYIGPFAVGLRAGSDACLVIDHDDDDVAFHESRGEHTEAQQYRSMIDWFTPQADLLVSVSGFGSTVSVPNVAPVATAPRAANRAPAVPTVTMFGNFRYGPNVEGATWLVDEVWPAVERLVPDAQLIVGGQGSESLDHGIGYIDDLDRFLARSTCTVAPILTGSGTRIKILESWSKGVPVVTTTVGVDGLDAKHRVTALIADDSASFALAIADLLVDESLRHSIAARAQRHVDEHFSKAIVAERTQQVLRESVTASVRRPGPAQADDLDVAEDDGGLVIFEPTAMAAHHLNPAAAVVFMLCDGETPPAHIADNYASTFGLSDPPFAMVLQTLDDLVRKRLLVR